MCVCVCARVCARMRPHATHPLFFLNCCIVFHRFFQLFCGHFTFIHFSLLSLFPMISSHRHFLFNPTFHTFLFPSLSPFFLFSFPCFYPPVDPFIKHAGPTGARCRGRILRPGLQELQSNGKSEKKHIKANRQKQVLQ